MPWKILLLVTALLPLTVAAQEQVEQDSDSEAPPVEAQQTADKPPKRSEQNADDYRPSEEISEDLSVSYPVDI